MVGYFLFYSFSFSWPGYISLWCGWSSGNIEDRTILAGILGLTAFPEQSLTGMLLYSPKLYLYIFELNIFEFICHIHDLSIKKKKYSYCSTTPIPSFSNNIFFFKRVVVISDLVYF